MKPPFGRINEFLKTFTPRLHTTDPHPLAPLVYPSSGTADSPIVQNIGKGFPRHDFPESKETLCVGTVRCLFCPAIERKTPWYLHDKIHDIVVCQDLHHRQYKLRILVVGSGPRWHEPWATLPHVHQQLFVALAEAFAAYAITKGQAKELVILENMHCLFPGHAHIQACLR